MRALRSDQMLGAVARAPYDRTKQPVGGRTAEPVPSNPFEPRLFASGQQQRRQQQPSRMGGQHGAAMHSLNEFAGAAGVPSSRAAGAHVHQGPRTVAASSPDHAHSAGVKAVQVGKEMGIFHQGPHARRTVPDEGTTRSKILVGAAAAVKEAPRQ